MGRKRLHADGLPERVYPHKNGFIYRPPEGKAIMLGKTLIDALAEHTKLTGQGVIVPVKRAATQILIRDLVDHLVTTHLPTLSPDTQQQYLEYLIPIKTALGDLPPATLKPKDLYAFMDGMTDSPARRNVILTQFRNIYKLAIRKGAAEVNIARDIPREPTEGRDVMPSLEELRAFAAAAGEWWACYIVFKLMTGLRQRDLIRLKPIPLTAKTFTVEISKSCRWKASERRRKGLQITYELTEALRAVLRRLYALKRPQSTEALFCNRHGRPYKPSAFMSAWDRTMDRMLADGVVTWRFHEHDIRATVASLDPENAQRRLGHKYRTTTDLYLRQFEGTLVQPLALENLEDAGEAPNPAQNIHPLALKM